MPRGVVATASAIAIIWSFMLAAWGCDRGGDEAAESASARQIDPNTPEGKARALIEQLAQFSAEGKWADGERVIKQLREMRAKLPPEVQQEIEGAINAFEVNRATYVRPGQQPPETQK